MFSNQIILKKATKMFRNLLLFASMIATSSSAPCDCLTSWTLDGETYEGCQTTRSSPSLGWCMVEDPTMCDSTLNGTDASSQVYSYKYCSDNLNSSVPCECLPSWTDSGAYSLDLSPSTCNTSQIGCPSTSCNNMNTYYAATYGYSSWCIVGNAPCDSAQLNTNGDAYMICQPDEVQGACDCKAQWTFNGTQYNGCQTTQNSPSAAWCVVDWTCNSTNGRLFGTDPSTFESFPYKYCADGIDANTVCSCGSNTCVNILNSYCVADNAPCSTTPVGSNGANNEAYITCSPSECDCRSQWTYKSVTYSGCQTTPDSPSRAWCFVGDNCNSAFPKNDTSGFTSPFKQCNEGLDLSKPCQCGSNVCQNTKTPNCEITNAPCMNSPAANNTAGKAYATCKPTDCGCLTSWRWEGVDYSGCQSTPNTQGATWCAVNNQTCNSASSGTDSLGTTISYMSCVRDDACDCLASWNHSSGVTYKGCQTTPDSPSRPWCYIDSNCPSALTDGFGYPYKTCDDNIGTADCTCGDCINANVPYCVINNAPCKSSPAGNNGDSNQAYASCTPAQCTCKASWNWGGNTYKNCSTTPDGTQTWCVVEDVACNSKAEITDPVSSAAVQSIFCTSNVSCDCLNPFDYNGDSYPGCSTSMNSPSVPWCKVDPACSWSQWSKDNQSSDYSWLLCANGLDANTTCECSDSCVDNGGGVQVCKSRAACKEATGANQYIKCPSAMTLSPNAPQGTTLTPSTMSPSTMSPNGTNYTSAPSGDTNGAGTGDDSSDGLSTGVIVLIILGSIFLVLAAVGGVFYFNKNKAREERPSFWNAGEEEMANDLTGNVCFFFSFFFAFNKYCKNEKECWQHT